MKVDHYKDDPSTVNAVCFIAQTNDTSGFIYTVQRLRADGETVLGVIIHQRRSRITDLPAERLKPVRQTDKQNSIRSQERCFGDKSKRHASSSSFIRSFDVKRS